MSKISFASYFGARMCQEDRRSGGPGPFLTISRQYGCGGYLVGQLVVDALNQARGKQAREWRIYNKFLLNELATETDLAVGLLERARRSKPSVVLDLIRAFSAERIPSGAEIRKQITILMRGLAACGHAVFVGQGSVHATSDIPGGLSVRMEAPRAWRVQEIATQRGLGAQEAQALIEEKEQERDYLRKLYLQQLAREIPFQLTYDCSAFSTQQIADHLVQALRLRGLV